MVENDTLTYHVKRTAPAKADDQSLITQERTQKLDLLTHLLANLTQSLVICGPEGIGKSTLLRILQQRKINSWLYCLVQGHADLSFEKIVQQVSEVINLKAGLSLPAALGQYDSRNNKIILMIDAAGDLVPGLIATLIQYAAANPVLRVVFVLTHDDLYLKNTTDRAIEDCHLIEIPPLSEKQCGDFLRHLAAKVPAPIAFNSISDSLIEKLYRKTHGIPGRIIAELPDLPRAGKNQNSTAILISAIAALVVIALGIQWYTNYRHEEKNPSARTILQPSKTTPALPQPAQTPVIKSEPLMLTEQFGREKNKELLSEQQRTNPIVPEQTEAGDVHESPAVAAEKTTIAENKTEATADALSAGSKPDNGAQPDDLKEPAPANNAAAEAPSLNKQETIQQAQTEPAGNNVASDEDVPATVAEEGTGWIMSQPQENFTLQVMVLTKEQAVKDVIKQHQALEQTLTYIKSVSPYGREKFLLLYGSFASAELANKARQSLPPEFRKAYPRKFSSIKN